MNPRTGSTTYRFRQPRSQVNPLALRRLQLQDVASRRREEVAVGQQELTAMREMARLEQQEYAVRQEITKERQVAAAQRDIAKLDPETDPQWRQKYAEVMSKNPRAQDNKFLNENFIQLGRVNQRVLEAGYRSIEEEQKQTGRMALKKEDEKRDFNKFAAHAANLHVNANDYRNPETGDIDWGGYNDALSAAEKSAKDAVKTSAAEAGLPVKRIVAEEGKPPRVTYEAAGKTASDIPAVIRSAHAKATVESDALNARAKKTEEYLNAETNPKKKEALQTSLAQIKADQEQAQIEKAAHEKAYPGLVNPAVNPLQTPVAPPIDTVQLDVPPIRTTAPISGGTATPSGEMAPLGTTPLSVTPPTSAPATPASPWDTLTEQMHRTNAALDKAHERRNVAMDTLAKMKASEYLNPFSTAVDDATEALNSANAEIDKHDATYKELFDKRGTLVKAAAPATPAPTRKPLTDFLPYN